jgi:Cu-Zn family superoxide dismutase
MGTARILAWVCVVAAGILASSAAASADDFLTARARIMSCTDGSFVGSAHLFELPSSEGIKVVNVVLSVEKGLVPGKHGVHIHEVGACTPSCSDAGSHLDIGPAGDNVPVTANHPYHSGDLVNVRVGTDGEGRMATATSRIALSLGNLSIFDADGSAIVIHLLPDTYCADPNDPNCAGGGRAACGVIQRERNR